MNRSKQRKNEKRTGAITRAKTAIDRYAWLLASYADKETVSEETKKTWRLKIRRHKDTIEATEKKIKNS